MLKSNLPEIGLGPEVLMPSPGSSSRSAFRRTSKRSALCVPLVLCLLAVPVHAQYMYLDANGDGVHTAADVVNSSGTTTFDVWIRTDTNRDGTSATCSSGDGPLNIRSYQFILHSVEGTVTWGAFTNAQPQAFPSFFGSEFDSTDAFVSFAGFGGLPPGTYKLGTLTAAVHSGTPSLTIAADSHLSDGYITAFGSSCSGSDFDGFIKLGPNVIGPGDWTDTDGLEFGGTVLHAPVLAPVPDLTVDENATLDQPLSATDVDGDPLVFSKISGPSFLSVSTLDPGSGTASSMSAAITRHAGGDYHREVAMARAAGSRAVRMRMKGYQKNPSAWAWPRP